MADEVFAAAIIGVRDEVSLIEGCISHLQAIGGPQIVVIDTGSSDGTEVVLERLKRQGKIQLVHGSPDDENAADFLEKGLDMARECFDPRWVLILDADEFWLPAKADIRSLVREDDVVVQLPRFNAWLPRTGSGWPRSTDEVRAAPLFVRPRRLGPEDMNKTDGLNWIRAQPLGKVMARVSAIGRLGKAGHWIVGRNGQQLPARPSREGLIVHVPFTSYERFEQKVRNIDQLARLHPGYFKQAGWHWTRWVEQYRRGALRQEYHEQQLSEADVAALTRSGELVEAGEFMASR